MKRNLNNIPDGTCRCSVCGVVKDNTEFPYYTNQFYNKGENHPLTGKRRRVNTNCVECTKTKEKERRSILKKFKTLQKPPYGSPCECCGKPVYPTNKDIPEGVNGAYIWQLDHDHETGEFRGWLCKQCNTGLGNLGDTLESLRLAGSYLERAKNQLNPSQQNLLSSP